MRWEDAELPLAIRAAALVEASERGRRELKRLGGWLDGDGRHLRAAVVALAVSRGVELADDAIDWPGKRLLRRAQARETAARVRTNPIPRDEDFVCVHCGRDVPAHGRTARDHCPWCLRSCHVDVVPGDRAASCGGRLDPVSVVLAGDRVVLHYRCAACGAEKVNRAVLDGEVPDDWSAIVALSAVDP